MKDLGLLKKMQNMPGGLVIIPLVLAVILATFVPQVFDIGGYTTALFRDGNSAMMGLFLIICGSAIDVRQVGMPLYKGVVLTGMKFLVAIAVGYLIGLFWGPAGIIGITPAVAIAAFANSNSSLYISLSSQFGDATDTGAISILSINDGPFLTLLALGATGLANVPFMALVATIVPLLIGFLWGNIDEGFRKSCTAAQPIITFFMTIAIGSSTDMTTILTAGASGIILGLISTVLGVIFFFVFNAFLPKNKRNAMGAAIGTTALNAAMTPAAIAAADPSFLNLVDSMTAQIATASIITLFLTPFLTAFLDKWLRNRKAGVYSNPNYQVGAEEAEVEEMEVTSATEGN